MRDGLERRIAVETSAALRQRVERLTLVVVGLHRRHRLHVGERRALVERHVRRDVREHAAAIVIRRHALAHALQDRRRAGGVRMRGVDEADQIQPPRVIALEQIDLLKHARAPLLRVDRFDARLCAEPRSANEVRQHGCEEPTAFVAPSATDAADEVLARDRAT